MLLYLARLKGFEPPTLRIGIWYSIQLSYKRLSPELYYTLFSGALQAVFKIFSALFSPRIDKRGIAGKNLDNPANYVCIPFPDVL